MERPIKLYIDASQKMKPQTVMKKSLYQINQEVMEITSQLEEGEFTPELETALLISQNELQEKAINYGYAIKSMDDDVTAINEEIKRLQAIKTAKVNAIERLKETISSAMQLHGIESVKSPTLKLSFRKSESIEINDLDQLNMRFKIFKTVVSADNRRIKEDILNGEIVTGARLIINHNLQIK